VHQYI